MPETPQDRGRAFDYELAAKIGGKRVPGSGNGFHKLDARGQEIIVEGKYTDAESFRVTNDILDKVLRAAVGPSAATAALEAFLVVKVGPEGRPLAVLDFDLLLSWIKEPPALVPATKTESLRKTARTPSLLRGT